MPKNAMSNYSENVLGILYRRKNSKDEWAGGAMYYLKDGLGERKGCKKLGAGLAVLFSCFCLLASFGIGNMSQVNSMVSNVYTCLLYTSIRSRINGHNHHHRHIHIRHQLQSQAQKGRDTEYCQRKDNQKGRDRSF